jgi:uncharacterized membrane protein
MIRPLGFVPLGAPIVMLMGLPQHVINFLSVQSFTWDPTAHYFMFPFISVMAAAVRTVVNRSRVWLGWALLGVMVVGVAVTQNQGIGPWTAASKQGYWPTTVTPNQQARARTISRLLSDVPVEATVATNSVFVPHLSHRPQVYTFPNPWHSNNFGPGQKPAHRSPKRVKWLFIEQTQLTGADATLFNQILADHEFTTVKTVTVPVDYGPPDRFYLMSRT